MRGGGEEVRGDVLRVVMRDKWGGGGWLWLYMMIICRARVCCRFGEYWVDAVYVVRWMVLEIDCTT
jgi:hypothetical protein